MNAYDFLSLGVWAAALVIGFIATLALAALVPWLLLILCVIVRDQYDKWASR
jgi:hypothetical protein